MYIDSFSNFCINITSNMISFINNKAFLPTFCGFIP